MATLRALKILSGYTIAVVLWTFVVPLLTSAAGGRDLGGYMIVVFLAHVPVMALALMVLLETKRGVSRTALWSCAVYTTAVVLSFAGLWLWFRPPFDPSGVVLAALYVPVAVFAVLVLVALKRRTI